MIIQNTFHGGINYTDSETGLSSIGFFPPYISEVDAHSFGCFRPLKDELNMWNNVSNITEVKLWIDDCRPSPNNDWIIAKNSEQAISIIKYSGLPNTIALDHDLGGDDTAMIVVHFIINSWLDKELSIPNNFRYSIHSQNPVGAKNIQITMENFLAHIKENSNYTNIN